MRARVLSVVLVAIVAAPVWAAAQSAPPTESVARSQVFQFERALKAAVEVGGQRLAEQARVYVPDTVLTPTDAPVANGVKLEDYGYHFDVQVPNIDQTSMMVFNMIQQARPTRGGRSAESAVPVAGRREVTSGPAAESLPVAAFEADKVYGARVKEALIDSMLDGSAMLTIAPTERLTLTVSPMPIAGSTALLLDKKLILTIMGSDLLDLRQGKITRDVAKSRIIESGF